MQNHPDLKKSLAAEYLSSRTSFRGKKSSDMSEPEKPKKEISTFRTILPQILASSAKNLLLLDLGMAIAFPTIVIPALRGLKPHDSHDILTLTDVQASWFGKKKKFSSVNHRGLKINSPQLASRSFSSRSEAWRAESFSNRSGGSDRWFSWMRRTSQDGCCSTMPAH